VLPCREGILICPGGESHALPACRESGIPACVVWLKWEITIFNDLPDLDLQMLRHYSTASQMVEATVCCLPWTGPAAALDLAWLLPFFTCPRRLSAAAARLAVSKHPVMFRRGWAYAVFFSGSDECLAVVQLYLYRGHSRKHTHPWLLETCIFDLSIYCSSLPQLSALGSDLIPTHQSRRRPNMLWSKWASRRQALR
jgi:hypothetical protein